MGGLGFRLMAVMGVALLPLAILSYIQGVQTAVLADGRVTNVIRAETMIAANPVIAEVVRAQSKVATLAVALPAVLRSEAMGDTDACRNLMDAVVAAQIGVITFAGYVDAGGQMRCGAGGREMDLNAMPGVMDQLLTDPGPKMAVNPMGPISNTSVLIFSHPVRDGSGGLKGFVFVSLPHVALGNRAEPSPDNRRPLSLITFDGMGNVLTSSVGMDAAAATLPASRPLASLMSEQGSSFVDRSEAGQRRAFAVVPLQQGALYLMGSWPANRLSASVLEGAAPAFLFPALMWAASLLVAWLAAESQVLRHVRVLRDRITAFAAGDRKMPALDMDGAASELRSVGQAYRQMTAAVVRNEADLENTIHQKEVLLREVHHRVKNNLQLIASILNMQLRSARTAEAKEAMRTVQDRVISLATVHRELYQTSGLTDVRADELIPRVARDLMRLGTGAGRRLDLETHVDDIRLTPDQAVPLALFLTEAMANVIKHTHTTGSAPLLVGLRLERIGESVARFTLTNPLVPEGATDALRWTPGGDGFGSQLLAAFSQQLTGTVSRGRIDDRYQLTLEFPLRPLTEAEERTAARPAPTEQADDAR
jgi:two-component sensor histidine kinase